MNDVIKISTVAILSLILGLTGGYIINKLIGNFDKEKFERKNKLSQLGELLIHIALIANYAVFLNRFILHWLNLRRYYNTTIILHASILLYNTDFTDKMEILIKNKHVKS
jgi:hypothetical protein